MLLLLLMMLMVFVAAIHDRYLPDTQLLQRLHHRIHHGNHLYTDVGLIDSDSVLQVPSTATLLPRQHMLDRLSSYQDHPLVGGFKMAK